MPLLKFMLQIAALVLCGVGPVASVMATVELHWVLTPTQPVVPGVLVDPDPLIVQDDGLNSTVVLQVLVNGKPAGGESIQWSSDDPTGNVQYLTNTTDATGLVRAWYHAGIKRQQTLIAQHLTSGKTLKISFNRANMPAPTVGRYAATYLKAVPGIYRATTISVIPRTAPERTYYALGTYWRPDGSISLYGGLQMDDCSIHNPVHATTCAASRGEFKGRMALFSAWNWKNSEGQIFSPELVNAPQATYCRPFTHEGVGLQCFAPLDWALNVEWHWTVEKIESAKPGFERIRVAATNPRNQYNQEIATIDIPGKLEMDHFSSFVENWGGKPSATCLDVELRKVTITSVRFLNGTQWVNPIKGTAMGGIYSGTMIRCQNYAFTSTGEGLDIASGGLYLWINLSDALVADRLSGRKIFPTIYQTQRQWQSLDISTLK